MAKVVRYLGLVAMSLGMLACGKDKDQAKIDFGYAYYPLVIGNSVEYKVDSVVYNEFTATVDSFSFLMREECVETFTDLEGRTAYRFERYVQKDDTSDFAFRTSFYVVTDGVRTEKVENNQREVVMVYPPKNGEDWDANAFSAADQVDYEFEAVHQALQLGSLSFDSALRVIQLNDTDNFITKRFSEERYAKHVGLVEKRYYHIETQFEVDSGLYWIQTVVGY
ncbi:MAG: hypothetical protein HQ500_02890 [Flavobacteriales bacterium]|nr:hypothetical protein [Flavobacteriales bacterium]